MDGEREAMRASQRGGRRTTWPSLAGRRAATLATCAVVVVSSCSGDSELAFERDEPAPAPAPATVAPTAAPTPLLVSAPQAGVVVGESTPVAALPASDRDPVEMKWYVDGIEVAHDLDGPPWNGRWDTWNQENGEHQVVVRALQESGTWTESPAIAVTVQNRVEYPVSGEPAPFGDLPGWKQSFVDDFPIDIEQGDFPSRVSTKWRAYPSPWRDTSGSGLYAPEAVVTIRDGSLRKHLRTEQGDPLVAALLPKVDGRVRSGSLYGRYSIRFRSDRMPGYKVAWLLWPDEGTNVEGSASGVGGNGEINFPEMDLEKDKVSGFVHFQDAVVGNDQYATSAAVDIGEWHTYTFEWSPDLVVMYLDGVEVGRTTERVPNTSMHWVIQTETSLSTEPLNHVSGVIEIDWVAAWTYEPTLTVDDL